MKFENLHAELVCSTEMIRALLAGIDANSVRLKRDADSWSMLEVLCHLYDEEREDFREHLDFILNRRDQDWHVINPQGWVTERSYNEQDFIEMQANFLAERTKSLAWLKTLGNENWSTQYTSPFGSMSAGSIFASWVAHDNLHIRQLVELRRQHIERITGGMDISYAGDW